MNITQATMRCEINGTDVMGKVHHNDGHITEGTIDFCISYCDNNNITITNAQQVLVWLHKQVVFQR